MGWPVTEGARSAGEGWLADCLDQHGVWWWCVSLTSIVGLLCAYAEWGWKGLSIAALTVAIFAALIGGSVCLEQGWRGGAKAARITVTAGLVVVAVTALLAALPLVAACLVLPLAATSPPATSLARRLFRASDDPLGSQLSDGSWSGPGKQLTGHESIEPVTLDLCALDDAALCMAWRRSFTRLTTARSTADSLLVVSQRQKYLDELYRRSPQGLVAWFNSGGRASGNPLPFLEHESDVDPWNELKPPDAGGAHL
jgi:hypothetical protein